MLKKEVNCDYCNKEIIKEIDDNLKHHFCDRNCYNNYHSRFTKMLKCDYCKEEIVIPLNQLESRKHHFCNGECYAKWQSETNVGINNHSFGKPHPWTSKRNKENNPMNNPSSKLKAINSIKEGYKTGRIKSWCTGLTKETNDILKRIGEKLHSRVRTQEVKEKIKETHWSKSNKREKTIEKLSNTRKKLFNEGKLKPYNKGLTKENCESLKKASEKLKGKKGLNLEKNPNWKGGISFEPYGLDFNTKLKRIIKERDNQCMLCNANFEILKELKRKIDVHHIDYDKTNSFPQNLITLCVKCHTITNYNRDKWNTFFQSLLKEKYNYEYTEDQKIILDFTK